jgi:hypothetical protein
VGDPHLSLRALVLADEPPYLPLERLLERGVDLVLCLGDLTRHDLEPLGSVQLPKLGVHGNHDDGGEFTGLGIENVHLQRIEVAGLCFGGFSGSHEYGREPRYTWSQKRRPSCCAGSARSTSSSPTARRSASTTIPTTPRTSAWTGCATTSSASARR